MGAKSFYWLKLYYEILDDQKMGRLPDNVWRRCIECFLMAGELRQGGFLPEMDAMTWRLRVDEKTLTTELSQLAQVGIVELRLDGDGHERWFVSRFADRQKASKAAERMRQLRDRKRKERKEAKERNEEPAREEDVRYTDNIPLRNALRNVRDDGVTNRHGGEYIPEQVQAMITSLTQYVKTTCSFQNEGDFRDAAESMIGWNATEDQLGGFQSWWDTNGHYPGLPALKSLVEEWRNYRRGVHKQKADGPTLSQRIPKPYGGIRETVAEVLAEEGYE